MPKRELNKTNLSDLVVQRIKEYIVENNLLFGDRLPPEQELATMFGVSRISIREATKALNFIGVIDAAPRRGLTIGRVNIPRVANILSFQFMLNSYPKLQILKARQIIEIGSLQHAMKAVVSNDNLYHTLINLCDQLDNTHDPKEFLEGDVKFHRTLVEAADAKPLLVFIDVLNAFFHHFQIELLTKSETDRTGGSKVHRKIVTSLRNSDLIGAETAMREHLEVFNGYFKND
jgi:GntR family transcriptional repressor for pyruvate dehydrogenase complex